MTKDRTKWLQRERFHKHWSMTMSTTNRQTSSGHEVKSMNPHTRDSYITHATGQKILACASSQLCPRWQGVHTHPSHGWSLIAKRRSCHNQRGMEVVKKQRKALTRRRDPRWRQVCVASWIHPSCRQRVCHQPWRGHSDNSLLTWSRAPSR